MKYLILILLLNGCSFKLENPYVYETSSGTKCFRGWRESCGYALRECDDGLDRECQTNITWKRNK